MLGDGAFEKRRQPSKISGVVRVEVRCENAMGLRNDDVIGRLD